MTFHNIRKAFEFFDCDGNGKITEEDIVKSINPLCMTQEIKKQIFMEIRSVLKEDPGLAGIGVD